MILSKVAAVREPPCIEVDDGHEQERNVPRVVNIESIFAVITPKLHEKVEQKRRAHGIASDQKNRQHFTHIKKDFQFSRREEETSTIASVLVRGTSQLFSSRWCEGTSRNVPCISDGIIST